MASLVAARAHRAPPFSLKPTLLSSSYATVRLTHTFANPAPQAAAGSTVTRKVDTIYCEDASDKEYFIRTIHEFLDACSDARLNASDTHRWALFRQVLGGDLRITYDEVYEIITNDAAFTQQTDETFRQRLLPAFIQRFLPTNSFLIQKEYMQYTVKPYAYDVFSTSNRFRLLNVLSAYLPGSANNPMFNTDADRKMAFFRLMLPEWQVNFATSGHTIDDAGYTYHQLVQYMATQETVYNAKYQAQRAPNRPRQVSFRDRSRQHRFTSRFNQPPAYQSPQGRGHWQSSTPSPRHAPSPSGRGSHRPNPYSSGGRSQGSFNRYRTPQSSAGRTPHPSSGRHHTGRGGFHRSPYHLRSRHTGRGPNTETRRSLFYLDHQTPTHHDSHFNHNEQNDNIDHLDPYAPTEEPSYDHMAPEMTPPDHQEQDHATATDAHFFAYDDYPPDAMEYEHMNDANDEYFSQEFQPSY